MTTRNFDIAIIGGGIIGLTLARALAKEHADVAVIDAGAKIPPATNAAAGMLAPSFEGMTAADDALYVLCARSLGMWGGFAAELQDEVGLSIDYRADGILGVAFDDNEARRLSDDADALTARGADIEILDGDAARHLEPALAETIAGALYAKNDAQVDPRKTLTALRAAIAGKVEMISSRRVDYAARRNSVFSIGLDNGDHVEAARLVIASGAAAGALIDELPLPPVYPVKGEAVALAMPKNMCRRVVRAPGAYLCPKAGGRLVIGATERDHCDNIEVDHAAVTALIARGGAAMPAIASLVEIERWAGLRPATPDGAPILGYDPRGPDGVFLALGHHRNGILLAPASAAALVDEILGRGRAPQTAAFRPDRFSRQ